MGLDELRGTAARAAAVDAAARLRQRAALPARPSTRPACTPTTAASWPTSRSSRPRARPTCATTTRSACSPSRRTRSAGSTPPAAPPAGRPSSATPSATSTPGPRVMARSIRAAGGRPGDKLHIAYGYGLFTGGLGAHYGAEKLGCTVIPISGGMTPAPGAADPRTSEPRVIMVTPSYMLTVIDEFEKQGVDPRATSPGDRHLRRRAVDRADARRRWRSASTSTPSTSTGCRRSWAPASRRSAWRPRTACTSGRTTSTRRSSTRSPARCCPRASRASWSSPRSPRRPCRSSATAPAT